MAKICFAPTFRANNMFACWVLSIIYTVIIAMLAIPALFSAEIRCYIRQLLFRIKYCWRGNSDPNITI